jgi:hypothetical protein
MTVDHDKIKLLLAVWGSYRIDRAARMTEEVKRLDDEIHRLSPQSVRILELQYCDPRPQKSKAAMLKMSRQIFSAHLRWIHDQLSFALS